jgi:CRISP-associated protein Cas1
MFTETEIWQAWLKVERGSRCAGVDGITPELFRGIAEQELVYLYDQLTGERYGPQPMLGFHIPKPNGNHRLVGIATVRDRVVQRLLLDHLYPLVEPSLSNSSYAYRPGYSVGMAVNQFLSCWFSPKQWVLQVDVKQFFENLRWPLLFSRLERLPLSDWLQHLLRQHVQVGLHLGGQLLNRCQGVIQGSVLSGLLANLYLSDFDHHCHQAGLPLIRYGDDLALVCSSERQAQFGLNYLQTRLQQLQLSLNSDKTRIVPPGAEIIYLGHRIVDGNVIATVKDWHPYRKRQNPNPPRPFPGRAPQSGLKAKTTPPPVPTSTDYWSEPMTTLYITDQGAVLRVKQQQFQIYVQQELQCEVPVHRVSHILLFGCCNLTHGATSLALQHKIPVMFLSQHGQYFGRLQTSGQPDIGYLTQQVLKSQDPDMNRQMAATLVLGKLHNSRIVLQRLNRRRTSETTAHALTQLEALIGQIPPTASIESLRGYEGQGARLYFQGLGSLFKGPFQFEKRSLRPPENPINSLMSLGYTLLHQNLFSMVMSVGLHSHFGHLHTAREHHPALVMDLTEEFRAPVVDSLIAYLINSQIFTPEDFTPPDEQGGVYLFPEGLRRFLKHWEDRLQTQVTHPLTGYRVSYRRCLELQVWEYVAWLTGDQPVYRPMLWSK